MSAGDVRKKFKSGKIHRGSQVIFGERQHLREVLSSLRTAKLPRARMQKELLQLKALIQARTDELNRISSAWDPRYRQALDPASSAQVLLKLAATLASDNFLLARALAEHANAPRKSSRNLPAILITPCAKTWLAIRALLPQRWRVWQRTRTSRSGFWLPAIPQRPPNCASACELACVRPTELRNRSFPLTPLVPKVDWLVSTLD